MQTVSSLIQRLMPTHNLNDRQRIAMELLLVGVAFQKDGRTWDIISHYGDHLGTMSTFMVCETTCLMKRQGLKPNGLQEYGGHPNGDSKLGCITFGRNIQWNVTDFESVMDRRYRNPVHLQ